MKDQYIKIANISEEGRSGGPQLRIALIARSLKSKGVDTTIIISRYSAERILDVLRKNNIPFKAFSLHRLQRGVLPLLRYSFLFLPELVRLSKSIRLGHFDVVHANSWRQFKPVLAGKMAGVKVLWHLNAIDQSPVIKFFIFLVSKFCVDGFIFSGERVKQCFLPRLSSLELPFEVIRPPVDTTRFNPETVQPAKDIEAYSGIKVVAVSSVNVRKGIEYFIEMVRLLNQKFDFITFILVGPTDRNPVYFSKMMSLKKKYKLQNLIFHGPSEDVPAVLKAADIFVCPSISESGPMSVWEAMSMAKPVVTTDVGDVTNFIESGINGYVVPIRDGKALSESVEYFINFKDHREQLAKNARLTAMSFLDAEVGAELHKQIYKRVLS